MPLTLTYAKNFLAEYTPPETIESDTTNERIADRYGQVYITTRQNNATLRVISEAGAEIASKTQDDVYNDFANAVADTDDAYTNLTAQFFNHCLVGDGRYLLVSLVAIKPPLPGDLFNTQYKRYFILYECVSGSFPVYRGGVWTNGQETIVRNCAYIWNDGSDDDPLVIMGLYKTLSGNPDAFKAYVLPSINDMLISNVDPWWQFTSAGKVSNYHMPRIEFTIPDTGGFNAGSQFAETTNGLRTPQGVRLFKFDGSTKALWYITKRGIDEHNASSADTNEWVENVVAPVRTTALVSVDLGTVNPANCAPTSADNFRELTATVADDTTLLQTLLTDDGKEITNVATDGDTAYQNPKVFKADGEQYAIFTLVSYDATDITSDQPNETYVQLVRIKIYKYDPNTENLVFETEAEGEIFNSSEFWDSGTKWGIHNIGTYVGQSGNFIVAGINGVDSGSIKQRRVWFTSFGTLSASGVTIRRKVQII